MSPKFLAKDDTVGSMLMPKEESNMPTNKIHVIPKEKDLILRCSPTQMPTQTTIVSRTMDCVTEGDMKSCCMNDMVLLFSVWCMV